MKSFFRKQNIYFETFKNVRKFDQKLKIIFISLLR